MRIKRIILIIGYGFFIISFAGCSLMHRRGGVATTAGAVSLPAYSGPQAQITVVDFDVKAAKATSEIGLGLREMLIAALIKDNRFSVVERQAGAAVMQEDELAISGAVGAGNDAGGKGKNKTADLIITACVTEFEPQASGGRAGVGGGGGAGSGVLGGLLGAALNKAHLALDMQIIDNSTSKLLAATRVRGQASDVSGATQAGLFGSWGLGTGLSAYANTPMEKAIRVCIIEAERYISQTIPESYYKY